ncbi:MAG: serine/threonine protein kinase [Deltaproteobacteria bacterium]|nr:serine/threonine protein kinase [Deltaproteobacteria bacterium]
MSEALDDRFERLRQAAVGGMGVVYEAREKASGAHVALKVLHTRAREDVLRFEREAAILAQLEHPGIVRYIAHGVAADGTPYLAMDWVDGETLDARLARTGLSVAETVELGRRIAGALGYAHARGVLHRDMKPANIILPGRDLARVAILDFGVARRAATGGLTETGALVGTPAYMAPEQARGERGLSPAVDVFALGCVLYECLTGRRAFEGKHVLALVAKVVLWDPPPVQGVPAALAEAVQTMLAKDPAARPRDGAEVERLLAAIDTAPGPRVARPAAPAETVRNDARGKIASIVVATPAEVAAGTELPGDGAWSGDRERIAALVDGALRWEVLRDGSLVAVLADSGGRRELAERAVACAAAVRRAMPDALIAIATGEIADGDPVVTTVGALVDDTVAALAREAMVMVFAKSSRPAGAIRVDERTAAALPPERVLRVKQAWYVEAT